MVVRRRDVTLCDSAFNTVGWRYSIAEAPLEPANRPPDNRRKQRLEFLASVIMFGDWEIPYHAITKATLFAPGMPLQILRLTTSADVFEFVVGRGKLPSDLPFTVTPAIASPETEFGLAYFACAQPFWCSLRSRSRCSFGF